MIFLAQSEKRYRRQDEIGTPYCITYDYDSINDESVTVRDRDNMTQERVKISDFKEIFRRKVRILKIICKFSQNIVYFANHLI